LDVLVLNYFYMPIACIPWQKAFTLIYVERAEEIEYYSDREIHSAHQTFKMPSVIRILRKTKQKPLIISFSREVLYFRDEGKCAYCGKFLSRNSFTLDHILPKSRGGKINYLNSVISCSQCNLKKGNRTPSEAHMNLLTNPIEPRTHMEVFRYKLALKESIPECWKKYLF